MNTQLITMINDLSVDADGWAQIAPLGDYPGMAIIPDGRGGWMREAAVQRLDAASLATMANEYTRNKRGLTGLFRSRPLYEGHPDSPVGSHLYPNKSPVGVFLNIRADAAGLSGEPVMTDDGERMIAQKKYRALSGRWDAEDTGEKTADGRRIFRPVKFLSAGLTNNPNLPVQMLNEAEPTETQKQRAPMKKLTDWLKKHGITIANDADEEQVETALAQLDPQLTEAATIANERNSFTAEKGTLTQTIAQRDQTITDVTRERDALKTDFANERKARIDSAIGAALAGGKITAADKPAWETRLGTETSFANELTALNALKPAVKTESSIVRIGDRQVTIANEGERRTAVSDLVASIALRRGIKLHEGNNYSMCYQIAQKESPALFEAMKKPGEKA